MPSFPPCDCTETAAASFLRIAAASFPPCDYTGTAAVPFPPHDNTETATTRGSDRFGPPSLPSLFFQRGSARSLRESRSIKSESKERDAAE
ncbi:hypothetical protein NL676_031751 [Syzygium grande]|nr:hypothetical protein NL676_031751 [Syzygium grande]